MGRRRPRACPFVHAALYQLMRDERELILALLSADTFHAEEIESDATFAAAIRRFVDMLKGRVGYEAGQRPLRDLDPSRALLLSFALVLGLSQLEDAIELPGHPDLGGEPLIDELVKFTLYGVSGRPDPDAPTAPRDDSGVAHLFDRIADAERRAIRAEIELEHLKQRPEPTRRD